MRGVGAALVAASIVLAGCGVVEVDEAATTTTTVDSDGPVNPWSLPLEERPPLFDPCSELPIEAVVAGVGEPVGRTVELTRHSPGELMSCGWGNTEVQVSVISTWKPYLAYVDDPVLVVDQMEYLETGRPSLRMLDGEGDSAACLQLFFTQRGAVWVMLGLVDSLSRFRGQAFADSCDALDEVVSPMVRYIPEGDYR